MPIYPMTGFSAPPSTGCQPGIPNQTQLASGCTSGQAPHAPRSRSNDTGIRTFAANGPDRALAA